MTEASQWYKKLIVNYENTVSPTYLFRYSQALKGIGKYKEADKWFKNYKEKKLV